MDIEAKRVFVLRAGGGGGGMDESTKATTTHSSVTIASHYCTRLVF